MVCIKENMSKPYQNSPNLLYRIVSIGKVISQAHPDLQKTKQQSRKFSYLVYARNVAGISRSVDFHLVPSLLWSFPTVSTFYTL